MFNKGFIDLIMCHNLKSALFKYIIIKLFFIRMFRPMGEIGWGSIPLAFVGFVAFLLTVLRFISLKLSLSVSDNSIKEVPMKKTSTVRIFVSSILETFWAAGVNSVVGHLST